jgi:hypothetical protein
LNNILETTKVSGNLLLNQIGRYFEPGIVRWNVLNRLRGTNISAQLAR